MKTCWNFHELYLWHNTGRAALIPAPGLTIEPGEHAENAETKRRFRNLMEVSGLTEQLISVKSTPMQEEDLARVHPRDYIERVKAISAGYGGEVSHHTPLGHGSYEIACLSAGGTYAVMDAVLNGTAQNGYALVRPPGHHAEPAQGMGFCLFANVPISILKARTKHKFGRVATVDWDVHHGNGTEACFYEDPDVLTISLHQEGLYPQKRGYVTDCGKGKGEGYNINIPLPAGSGHGAYIAAFERVVIPALYKYKPDLIIVPSGFDAAAADPLGCMMLFSESYRQMTRMLKAAAADLCGGRLVMSHEGGYSAAYVPYCGLAVMEELSEIKTPIDDPFRDDYAGYPGQSLHPWQEEAIAKSTTLLDKLK